jgi:hypothetical protein
MVMKGLQFWRAGAETVILKGDQVHTQYPGKRFPALPYINYSSHISLCLLLFKIILHFATNSIDHWISPHCFAYLSTRHDCLTHRECIALGVSIETFEQEIQFGCIR